MLAITVRINERPAYNEVTKKFTTVFDREFVLELEHSLASLSKWEVEHEVPFLAEAEKTPEQTLSYIKYMTLTPDVPPEVYQNLTDANMEEINKYLQRKMTATWFRETPGKVRKHGPTYTAEVIYYMMFSLNIPLECENWNLTRLLTLIRVFNENNKQPEKQDKHQAALDRQRINEQRRAEAERKRREREEGK